MSASKKIIISHRGNLWGPNSCAENSEKAMVKAIELGFHVEMDLQAKVLDLFFFGHDKIEHVISYDKLTVYDKLIARDTVWIHGKNGFALQAACDSNFICFGHDKDNFVMTSNGYLWRYPDPQLPVTPRTIMVLPEREQIFLQTQSAAGFCTDYPILMQFLVNHLPTPFNTMLWNQGIKLDQIYNDMAQRQCYSEWECDPLLTLRPDHRRCLAVFSRLRPYDLPSAQQLSQVAGILQTFFPRHLLYSATSKENHTPNCENRCSVWDATLHFTHMQLITFDKMVECDRKETTRETTLETTPKSFQRAFSKLHDKYFSQKLEIVFHRVLMMSKSIMMVGYPSWDVEGWRQGMRSELKEEKLFSEPHAQNIVHATLLRFVEPNLTCSDLDVKSILGYVQQILPIRLKLAAPQLALCSWQMNAYEPL